MAEFNTKEEYEKWKAARSAATKAKIIKSDRVVKDDRKQPDPTDAPEIPEAPRKQGKSKSSLFIILSVFLSVVILGCIAVYMIYFRPANVAGLWTGEAELENTDRILKPELKDDKLPVDISLVLKNEDNHVISGKLTLKKVNSSNVDIPIEVNGTVDSSQIKFIGENNMLSLRTKAEFSFGKIKEGTLIGHLIITFVGDLNYRMFDGSIKLKRY